MALAVVIGTLFDMLHDQKIKFFLRDRLRAKAAVKRQLGVAAMASIAGKTLLHDIATFGEF